jgi:hypothetical protein
MSTTKHNSFIPMSPELRPRQKLNEVVTIPELSKGLDPKVQWVEPLLRDPPKASPRKLTFLFSVEWSWSPAHNRQSNSTWDKRTRCILRINFEKIHFFILWCHTFLLSFNCFICGRINA